jgi:hypothetical protein
VIPTDDGYSQYGDHGPRRTERARSTSRTRTRYPDLGADDFDPDNPQPRPPKSSRSLITIVGVVVLLIAAIAFANRGGGDDGGAAGSGGGGAGAKGATAAPTAPTGEQPVTTKNSGIPSGFARTQQGAQSAAANYAAVLGSDGMFNAGRRTGIVKTVAYPADADRLVAGFDADYSAALFKQLGLNEDGSAPDGETFVNRTLPVGTKVVSYTADDAEVAVWCNSLFGMAGAQSTRPVTSGWFTVTLKLKWNGSDWKVVSTSQKTGPTPVNGDNPISTSDDIAGAVNEFGGFTYAR